MTHRCPWLHAFLDVPAALLEPTARFWAAVSGATVGTPWPDHPEFRSLEPATGSRYMHVQRHGGEPRVHLDLTTPDIDAEAARLVALGATAGRRERWWQVLDSPGGLPFCLVEETPGRSRPDPVRWPGGHTSRVDRLALEAPPARRDAEFDFWLAATGWSATGDRDQLRPPDSSPLGLVLRRGADRRVRAHPVLGTDDVAAEVRRVVELGATVTAQGQGRVTLADPVGLAFQVAAW